MDDSHYETVGTKSQLSSSHAAFIDATMTLLQGLLQRDFDIFWQNISQHLLQKANREQHSTALFDLLGNIGQFKADSKVLLTSIIQRSKRNFLETLKNPHAISPKAINEIDFDQLSLTARDEMDLIVAEEKVAYHLTTPIDRLLQEVALSFSNLFNMPHLIADDLPFHPKQFIKHLLAEFDPIFDSNVHRIVFLEYMGASISFAAFAPKLAQLLSQHHIPKASVRRAVSSVQNIGGLLGEQVERIQDAMPAAPVAMSTSIISAEQISSGAFAHLVPSSAQIYAEGQVPLYAHQGHFIVNPADLIQHAQALSALNAGMQHAPITPQYAGTSAQFTIVPTDQVIELLHQLQLKESELGNLTQAVASVEYTRNLIRSSLNVGQHSAEELKATDRTVIDMVSLLFELMFKDNNQPDAVKTLISKLQLPFLQVALKDLSFFMKEDHPARVLLNALARAGVGLDSTSEQGDEIFQELKRIVGEILVQFNGDVALFSQCKLELDQFMQKQQLRIESVENKTRRDAENNARTVFLQEHVQQEINHRLVKQSLPLQVVKLIQDAWKPVMLHTVLRYGLSSAAWSKVLNVLDAMIWSVTPHPDITDWLEQLGVLMPKLRKSIFVGLEQINFDPYTALDLVSDLEQLHQKFIDGECVKFVDIVDAAESTSTVGVTTVQLAVDDMHRQEISVHPVTMSRADDIAQNTITIDRLSDQDTSQQAWIDRVVLNKTSVHNDVVDDTLATDHPLMREVMRLKTGSWVEFIRPSKTERLKCVARLGFSGKLVFANKRGVKAFEMSEQQLAIEIHQARARIIDMGGEVFDRALSQMVDKINRMDAGR